MTTIVADRKGMAADKRVSGSGAVFKTSKLHRVNGSVIGFCGNAEQALQFIEWRRNPDAKPTFGEPNFEILELTADGQMLWWGTEMVAITIEDDHYAIGSGAAYALGAMASGASVKKAIEIAAMYDANTGTEVQTLMLGEKIMTAIDPNLRDYATPREIEHLDAIDRHGGIRPASKALGIARQSLQESMVRLKKRAALKGYAPGHFDSGVAPGFVMGKVTVQRANGVVERTWERQSPEDARWLEAVKEAIQGFTEGVGQVKVPKAPLDFQSDVIPWIQIGDAHVGLLTHANEVGENFDLRIAERELCSAIGILVDELPPCERIVVNDLGDFTHYENFEGETQASKHRLDFDSRFPKMIKVYSRIMRYVVEKALEKALHVDVIINQGNHSRTNDIWMAELLEVAYGHTGRVHVLNNGTPFIAYRMGNTLVMTHHSDKCKPQRLADVMTTDFRKDYGETEFHYIDIGHIHHGMVLKEHPGVFIESFNHLAHLDKWAHDAGYRNRRSITIVLRSRQFGEVGRRLLPIQEVRARMVTTAADQPPTSREVFSV